MWADNGNITMVLFRFFPPSSRIFSLIFISFKDLYVFASIVFLIESFWWVCSTLGKEGLLVPTIYVSVNVRNGVTIVSLQLADVAGALRGILLSRSVQFSSVQYDPFVIIIHTSNVTITSLPHNSQATYLCLHTDSRQNPPCVCVLNIRKFVGTLPGKFLL